MEGGTRSRVAFDGGDGGRAGLHHTPEAPRVPCAGVRRGSCPALCALGWGRRCRGRSAAHGGCSSGRRALRHRSASCGFGLDVGEGRGQGREGRTHHCKQATYTRARAFPWVVSGWSGASSIRGFTLRVLRGGARSGACARDMLTSVCPDTDIDTTRRPGGNCLPVHACRHLRSALRPCPLYPVRQGCLLPPLHRPGLGLWSYVLVFAYPTAHPALPEACQAVPGFQVSLTGGDGDATQYCNAVLASLPCSYHPSRLCWLLALRQRRRRRPPGH